MDKARRGARVATRFLVAVEGLDATPVLRKGDISGTGIYFEIDRDVGDVGTVQSLALTSLDRSRSVRVMAHVVRTVKMADADQTPGRGSGVRVHAGERQRPPRCTTSCGGSFRCASKASRRASLRGSGPAWGTLPRVDLARRHGAEPERAHDGARDQLGHPAGRAPARRHRGPGDDPCVCASTAWRCGWAPKPGYRRALRHRGRGEQERKRPIRIGLVDRHERDAPQSGAASADREEVSATGCPSPASDEDEVTHVLDELLSALILPPDDEPHRKRRTHLSGELSRIRLPTLCSLFEIGEAHGQARRAHRRCPVSRLLQRRSDRRRRAPGARRVRPGAHRAPARGGRGHVRVPGRAGPAPESARDDDDLAAHRPRARGGQGTGAAGSAPSDSPARQTGGWSARARAAAQTRRPTPATTSTSATLNTGQKRTWMKSITCPRAAQSTRLPTAPETTPGVARVLRPGCTLAPHPEADDGHGRGDGDGDEQPGRGMQRQPGHGVERDVAVLRVRQVNHALHELQRRTVAQRALGSDLGGMIASHQSGHACDQPREAQA